MNGDGRYKRPAGASALQTRTREGALCLGILPFQGAFNVGYRLQREVPRAKGFCGFRADFSDGLLGGHGPSPNNRANLCFQIFMLVICEITSLYCSLTGNSRSLRKTLFLRTAVMQAVFTI